MVEVELKFQVPPAQREALRRAVAGASARRVRLQARYFDTAERRLAEAGIALRLRREDGHWVQTLKARGDGVLTRPEHNVVLLHQRGEPQLDLARHDGTPAGEALRATGVDAAALRPLFAAEVRRVARRVRSAGVQVEVAYDEGELVAGEARLPLAEIEFELVSGTTAGLLALAARWVDRHGLWLDVRTKAERGDLLARGRAAADATHAIAPVLDAADTPDAALRAMVRACLAQVLPNASAVAAGVHEAEHVHQLRVGLRRLRTALRDFGDAAADLDPGWEPALAQVFARLGAARDRDALAASLLPALAAAGAPLVDLPPASAAEEPGQPLREPAWTRLLLALIGFANGGEPPPAPAAEPAWSLPPQAREGDLRGWARQRLKRAHRRAVANAASFATLPEADQHRVRKRVKRLRYSVEFLCALYPAKAVARYLKLLRPAQEALGEYNDVLVAQAAFAELGDSDARAWFALGWLSARRAECLAACTRALERLAEADGFWRAKAK
jgi:inorganic triphosphatase YgiF